MHLQGYSGREQDTYGTLLACGDLLLFDAAPDRLALAEEGARVPQLVRALGTLVNAARTEAEDTSERCVKHLASHRLPAKGGETPQTVARWIQQMLVAVHANNTDRRDAIRERLASHGLRVVHLAKDHEGTQGGLHDAYVLFQGEDRRQSRQERDERPRVDMWLAVANKTNKGVQEMFAGSMWQGGVWTQSLSLITGSYSNKKARFGGGPAEGCVLVPLGEVVDIEAAIEEATRLA
jgi:hypothetical protein